MGGEAGLLAGVFGRDAVGAACATTVAGAWA